ncbi:hypothetical protein [Streptomyces virginiae]|uniref:hypothetical protein n=1 Tax=Streptomyces virginiae TaxID=1961 RepID=UPI0022561362|nr:hypothetical protein [Streptomyces virginiae]MCX5174598.1 hypothetical protein [Streptomyces virginiae]
MTKDIGEPPRLVGALRLGADGSGQAWTIKSWTPPAPPARTDLGALVLTGLFGPLADFL